MMTGIMKCLKEMLLPEIQRKCIIPYGTLFTFNL